MPLYRLDRKGWKIERIGAGLVITAGGKKTTRQFSSEQDAKTEEAKLVAEKLASGYRLAPSDPRHEELEAAILADPEAAAGYAVLGDWLQAQGDPRGELIGLQMGQKSPERTKAIAKLLEDDADYLLGPLAKLRVKEGAEPALEWKFGFIHRADLDSKNARSFLAKLLSHPSGRFLVELKLSLGFHEVVDTLAARPRPSLRGLSLEPYVDRDLTPLWPVLTELRRFKLTPYQCNFPTITLPKVEQLVVHIYELGSAAARAIARAPWPKVRTMKLGGGAFDLATLLERSDLPSLAFLALSSQRWVGEHVGHVADSPVAGNLEALELVDCRITDEGALELARKRDRFPRIVTLDVSDNPIGDKGLAALRAAFPNVRKFR